MEKKLPQTYDELTKAIKHQTNVYTYLSNNEVRKTHGRHVDGFQTSDKSKYKSFVKTQYDPDNAKVFLSFINEYNQDENLKEKYNDEVAYMFSSLNQSVELESFAYSLASDLGIKTPNYNIVIKPQLYDQKILVSDYIIGDHPKEFLEKNPNQGSGTLWSNRPKTLATMIATNRWDPNNSNMIIDKENNVYQIDFTDQFSGALWSDQQKEIRTSALALLDTYKYCERDFSNDRLNPILENFPTDREMIAGFEETKGDITGIRNKYTKPYQQAILDIVDIRVDICTDYLKKGL